MNLTVGLDCELNLHVSWIFLPPAPPPAPYIIDVGFIAEGRFSVEWMEARGSQMVNGFTFSTTPTGLSCRNNSMTTVTCSYNESNLGQTYTFTVAALNCGTQKGNEASHRIHLRGMLLTIEHHLLIVPIYVAKLIHTVVRASLREEAVLPEPQYLAS